MTSPADVPSCDVLLDTTSDPRSHQSINEHVERLVDLGIIADWSSATIVARPMAVGGSMSAAVRPDARLAFLEATSNAAFRRRDLLVLSSAVETPADIIDRLRSALGRDERLVAAQPRFRDPRTGGVVAIPDRDGHVTAPVQLSEDAIEMLDPTTIVAELGSACVLLSRRALSAVRPPSDAVSVASALTVMLTWLRRCGWRGVIDNRTICALSSSIFERMTSSGTLAVEELAYPRPSEGGRARLVAAAPEHRVVARMQSVGLLERLVAASRPLAHDRRRILVDTRGMFPHHDGVSRSTLGLLEGLSACDEPSWRITVLAESKAAEFHQLARRFPAWAMLHDQPRGEYAALLASWLPDSPQVVAEWHRSAWVSVAQVSDTLAWDAACLSPRDPTAVWETWAHLGDGLAFASVQAQQRFQRRFDVGADVVQRVVYPSLCSSDYVTRPAATERSDEYTLVVGNPHDHKDLGPTAVTLLDAFPNRRFVVLGTESFPNPRVRWMASGPHDDAEIDQLFAASDAVVYPSLSEGIGFPAIQAAAHGKPVLVRRSDLWRELTSIGSLPGQLVEFDDIPDLVESLGLVYAGRAAPALTFVGGHGQIDWQAHAKEMLRLVEACCAAGTARRWRMRDAALRLTERA